MPGKTFPGERQADVFAVCGDAPDEATISVDAVDRDGDPLSEDQRTREASGHAAKRLAALGAIDAFETNPINLTAVRRYVESIAVNDVPYDASDRRRNWRESTEVKRPRKGLSDGAYWPYASEHQKEAAHAPYGARRHWAAPIAPARESSKSA